MFDIFSVILNKFLKIIRVLKSSYEPANPAGIFNLDILMELTVHTEPSTFSSYFWNTPHPKQLQPLSAISSLGTVEASLAQNRAIGEDSFSLFDLNDEHGSQNFLDFHIFGGIVIPYSVG